MISDQESAGARLADEFRQGVFTPESVECFLREVIVRLRATGPFKKQEAEDIALITLEDVYSGIGSYRGDSAFFTWVMTIARRVAFDHHKKLCEVNGDGGEATHDRPIENPDELADASSGDGPGAADAGPDAEEMLLRRWGCEDALNSLDADERELVNLRIYKEYTFVEMAQILGSSADALQHRLTRTILPKIHRYFAANGWCDDTDAG